MPGRARWVSVVVAVCGLPMVGGCIGTTDRGDFDEIIQERGGGFTSELPLDAVAAVAAELGVDDFEARSIAVTPPAETVVLDVRDPAVPENLDRYVVRGAAVDSVEPIRLAASDDLDAETFPVSGVALGQIETMVDSALAEFDAGGYVSSMTVSRITDGVVIQLALESPRSTGTARFTGEGELVEVTRT
jgi:hypothetical protein